MRLSVAYNKKNLIDEYWVMHRLKQDWRAVNGYFWGAGTMLYNKNVWVSLSFGYKDDNQTEAMYFSSFGINSMNANESFAVETDYCWGKLQPSGVDVIWCYYDKIRDSLFPRGPRNKAEFVI